MREEHIRKCLTDQKCYFHFGSLKRSVQKKPKFYYKFRRGVVSISLSVGHTLKSRQKKMLQPPDLTPLSSGFKVWPPYF